MSMFCWPLRMTMSSALPSMIACTKRPRWLREAGARSQSAPATRKNSPTTPTTSSSRRFQVSFSPSTASTR